MKVDITIIGPKHATVVLKGNIDEHCAKDLAAILSAATSALVTISCERVAAINSIGCRTWIEFINQLSAKTAVEFTDCSPIFIDYCNLVTGFTGKGKVVSFFLPYRCTKCGDTGELNMVAAACVGMQAFPGKQCARCSSPMVAEVEAEDYLMFLE